METHRKRQQIIWITGGLQKLPIITLLVLPSRKCDGLIFTLSQFVLKGSTWQVSDWKGVIKINERFSSVSTCLLSCNCNVSRKKEKRGNW